MAPLAAIRAVRAIGDLPKHVPALSAVLGPVTVILEELENAKGNDSLRKALADDIVQIVLTIDEQFRLLDDPDDMPDEVLTAIHALNESLVRTYAKLEQLRTRRGGALSRILRAAPDADILKSARDDIKHAVSIYFLQARIYMTQASHALSQPTGSLYALKLDFRVPSQAQHTLGPDKLDENLPSPPPLLFGRDADLACAVERLLQCDPPGHSAILGAPGIGKTSLALAALHHERVCATFSRRIFIDCTPHPNVQALLTAFGFGNEKQFIAALRQTNGSRTLLVLDGYDTLLAVDYKDASAWTQQLCEGAEGLTLLVTMRGAERPADVRMQRSILGPLDRRSSEQLFQALRDNSLCPTTLHHAGSLMAQADGVPLALTLLARHESSTPNGDQDPSSNHIEGLEGVIASSVDRVGQEAKDALALLARAPDGLPRLLLSHSGVSALLRAALASSHLEPGTKADGEDQEERIRVLAPIRAYAMTHLQPPRDGLVCIREYYAKLAKTACDIGGGSTTAVLRTLERDAGNLNSILREAILDISAASPTSGSSDPPNDFDEKQWLEAVEAVIALRTWRVWIGSKDRALLETCVAALRTHRPNDAALLSRALTALSRLYGPTDEPARIIADEALLYAQRVPGDEGKALQVDALARRLIQDDATDLARLHRADELLATMDPDEEENIIRKTLVLLDLGQTHVTASRYADAARCFSQAAHLAEPLPNGLYLRARALHSAGHVAANSGRLQEASNLYVQAMGVAEAAGLNGTVAHCLRYQAWVNVEMGRFRQARELYLEAVRRFMELGYNMDEILARCGAVRATLGMGDSDHDILDMDKWPPVAPRWLYGNGHIEIARGEMALSRGHRDIATKHFVRAAQLFRERDAPDKVAECEMFLGDAASRVDTAERHWVTALAMYRRVEDGSGCLSVLKRWPHASNGHA